MPTTAPVPLHPPTVPAPRGAVRHLAPMSQAELVRLSLLVCPRR